MTDTTEELKLEEYLEAMRQDHAKLVESLQIQVTLYQDAYENQKALTRNACVYDRERWDELYQLRSQVEELKYNSDLESVKLHEATAKLASGSESIRALLRVIKSQQNAYARSQARLQSCEKGRESDKNYFISQIADALASRDQHWELLLQKQEIIVSQRKRIEELQISVMNASKHAPSHWFWRFFPAQNEHPQATPEKNNLTENVIPSMA